MPGERGGIGTDSYLLDEMRWFRRMAEAAHQPRPALFLDRDGTLIEERNYLADPNGVVLIDGGVAVLRHACAIGMAIVIVTNQSGIGQGYFGWEDYLRVENRLLMLLSQNGVTVDALVACGDSPSTASLGPEWRKPGRGMLTTAAQALRIDLARSVVIGDKASDLMAGREAGLRRGIHVATGHGRSELEAAQRLATSSFEVICIPSIAEAGPPLR